MAQSKRGVASVLLLATSTVVAGEACAATCFGASCDHWDGGAWGTCAHLEVTQGCDCSGCECDGCPQASCEGPRFDPIACPSAGDGRCDPNLNVEACAWDGGDCCAFSCYEKNGQFVELAPDGTSWQFQHECFAINDNKTIILF